MEYARICARMYCTTGGGFYEDIMRHPLTATLFTQYSVRKGIKCFGEDGITAVEEELQQLETRKVMETIDRNEMTREEKRVCMAQTENEPDASDTDEVEVNEVITENTEDENTNKDEPNNDNSNDDKKYQPDGLRQSKRKNKVKLKTKGPYQFENNSLAHRGNENARKWDNYIP